MLDGNCQEHYFSRDIHPRKKTEAVEKILEIQYVKEEKKKLMGPMGQSKK